MNCALIISSLALSTSAFSIFEYTSCLYFECCLSPWIRDLNCPGEQNRVNLLKSKMSALNDEDDKNKLRERLSRMIVGQHFLPKLVPKAILEHFCHIAPEKPLVLSFHGGPGTGKTFATSLIVDFLYERGMASNFVELIVPMHQYLSNEDLAYFEDKLLSRISRIVESCPRSLIIVDEVESFPITFLEKLTPLLEGRPQYKGVDYRWTTFLFVTNLAHKNITRTCLKFRKEETDRVQIPHKALTDVIMEAIQTTEGSILGTKVFKSDLIDVIVPFLPLEVPHVQECISREFRRQKVPLTEEAMASLKSNMEYFPKKEPVYVIGGCRAHRFNARMYLQGL